MTRRNDVNGANATTQLFECRSIPPYSFMPGSLFFARTRNGRNGTAIGEVNWPHWAIAQNLYEVENRALAESALEGTITGGVAVTQGTRERS